MGAACPKELWQRHCHVCCAQPALSARLLLQANPKRHAPAVRISDYQRLPLEARKAATSESRSGACLLGRTLHNPYYLRQDAVCFVQFLQNQSCQLCWGHPSTQRQKLAPQANAYGWAWASRAGLQTGSVLQKNCQVLEQSGASWHIGAYVPSHVRNGLDPAANPAAAPAGRIARTSNRDLSAQPGGNYPPIAILLLQLEPACWSSPCWTVNPQSLFLGGGGAAAHLSG